MAQCSLVATQGLNDLIGCRQTNETITQCFFAETQEPDVSIACGQLF